MVLHTSGRHVYNANNNEIIFKGIGTIGDLGSLNGQWFGLSPPEAGKNIFVLDQATLTARMDAQLDLYKNTWGLNLIRIFFPADWWYYDNLTAEYNQWTKVWDIDPYPNLTGNTLWSFRNYIILLAQRCMAKGIYLDFCPYLICSVFRDVEGGVVQGTGTPIVSTLGNNYGRFKSRRK
jgi:hypothetical protein